MSRRIVSACSAGNLCAIAQRGLRERKPPRLQIEPVNFVDDAIDIIVKLSAFETDGTIMRKQFFRAMKPLRQRIDRETPFAEILDHARLRVSRHVRHFTPGIGKEFEFAACRHPGIKLTQRACCRVARVHISLLAFGCHLLIERKEVALGHIDLTAYFHDRRHSSRKPVRNFGNGADVRRHILAGCAVSTRRAANQNSVLVSDRHGKSVDLRFGSKRDGIIGQLPKEAIDAPDKIAHVLVGKRIAKRQHWPRMDNFSEFRSRCSANPQGWTVRSNQMRKARFNRVIAPLQRVILGIRNFRPVIGMIKLIMMSNFARQPFQFGSGLRLGQFFDRNIGHRWSKTR